MDIQNSAKADTTIRTFAGDVPVSLAPTLYPMATPTIDNDWPMGMLAFAEYPASILTMMRMDILVINVVLASYFDAVDVIAGANVSALCH